MDTNAMNTDTNLRQSVLKANVEGILSEKSLKKGMAAELVPDKVKKGDIDANMVMITGNVTLKTDETNFIRFMVNVNAKTKAGEDNKIFAGLETIINEYQSIAEVGEDQADRIRVTNGDITLFTGRDGNAQVGYKSNFFNRVYGDNYNPHAEFEVEMYISNIFPEMDKDDDETGRLVVKGWAVTYNGVQPITLIAPKDIANDVENLFEIGQTAKFYGDIVNSRVEKITHVNVAIGRAKDKVETSYKNELIITGATEPYEEGVSEVAPYKADSIKLAIQERENALQSRNSQEEKNPFTNTPSGAAKGRTLNW